MSWHGSRILVLRIYFPGLCVTHGCQANCRASLLSMSRKLIESIGLALGAMGVLVVAGLSYFLFIWMVAAGLFLFSRLSKKAQFFSDWSWPQFLVTAGCGLGIPYVLLLLSAGF